MKTITLALICMATLLPGCANGQPAAQTATPESTGKVLVVYFSRSGNTEAVATRIQTRTGADVFRIQTVKPYPEEYRRCTEVAKEELNARARPEIRSKVDKIDQYDTVFIGFPIWWGTYPMAVATFLESHDLSGKTVIPFCTHGGSGRAESFSDLRRAVPGATHADGLVLRGENSRSAGSEIETWLRKTGVIE